MTVRVITDTGSALPDSLVCANNIRVVPLHIVVNGVDIPDTSEPDPGQPDPGARVYVGEGVTTSGPAPGDWAAAIASARAEPDVDGVVVVCMSGALSSGHANAVSAAGESSSTLVVDSRTTAMATGFAAIAAARAAAAGAPVAEVAAVAQASAAASDVFFCVSSLDTLMRGGRLTSLKARLGTALSIVPVLRVADGRLVLRQSVRTAARARERLVQLSLEAAGRSDTDGNGVRVGVAHVDSPVAAEAFADVMLARLGLVNIDVAELVVGPLSSAIAAHVGPGVLGVAISAA